MAQDHFWTPPEPQKPCFCFWGAPPMEVLLQMCAWGLFATYRRSNHMICRLDRFWPRRDPVSNRVPLVPITFKAAGSTKLVVAPILELHVSPLASWRGPWDAQC